MIYRNVIDVKKDIFYPLMEIVYFKVITWTLIKSSNIVST